jgi:hypothetical protein
MRKITAILIALAFAFTSASAFAQDDGQPRAKFYDFDDMLVDGQLKTPDLIKNNARGKAQFERLLNLKKSFMPKIEESANQAALQ